MFGPMRYVHNRTIPTVENEFMRSARQTWNSPVQPATLQITGHSELVLKLVSESPSSL